MLQFSIVKNLCWYQKLFTIINAVLTLSAAILFVYFMGVCQGEMLAQT